MITDEKLQKALNYLATTDESAAAARGLMVGLEKQEKTILAIAFLDSHGTVAERDAEARTSPEYLEWLGNYKDAVESYELLKNRRNTGATIVEVWRSENANRRSGNV